MYSPSNRYSDLVNTMNERAASIEKLESKLKDAEHAQKSKDSEIATLKEEAGASLQGKESLAQKLQGEVQKRDDEIRALQDKISELEKVSLSSLSFF
jgi:predicted  nucleic acid-binding Zn-ribbon protein